MRKRVVSPGSKDPPLPDGDWLDLEGLAQVEVTSEDAAHPIESALVPGAEAGRALVGVAAGGEDSGAVEVDGAEVADLVPCQGQHHGIPDVGEPHRHPCEQEEDGPEAPAREARSPGVGRRAGGEGGGRRGHAGTVLAGSGNSASGGT